MLIDFTLLSRGEADTVGAASSVKFFGQQACNRPILRRYPHSLEDCPAGIPAYCR